MVAVTIPEPGTSDARSARWLGFAYDCECHPGDNLQGEPGAKGPDRKPLPERPAACTDHTNDATRTDACSHVIHPDCGLHRGWTPGDTAEVDNPRWGAFAVIPPEHADAHAKWMADHA